MHSTTFKLIAFAHNILSKLLRSLLDGGDRGDDVGQKDHLCSVRLSAKGLHHWPVVAIDVSVPGLEVRHLDVRGEENGRI